jgi:type II secretory pathway pseudopilin PulG
MVLTVMMLALTAALPRLAQQIKRDREIEMVHRGDQYARAIKRYYKKTGRYPGRIEDLEKTNTIRFLRKRYKDPMSKDGAWRLVRYGEVQLGTGGTGAGVPAAQLAQGASTPGPQSGGMFNLNFSGGAGGAGANANPAITAVLGLAAGAGTALAQPRRAMHLPLQH